MTSALAFFFGLVFGVGLILSGMTDPARVLGFLDVAGHWDASLGFVMGGAVIAAAPLFLLVRGRQRPLTGAAFENPERANIDAKLIAGAATFGIGWGLAGLCPGPALVNLGLSPNAIWIFVLALAVGLLIGRGANALIGQRKPKASLRTEQNAPATSRDQAAAAERIYWA